MELEREVALLRKAGKISPSHDVRRFESNLDSLYMELDEKEKKICELEDFIVEQDEVSVPVLQGSSIQRWVGAKGPLIYYVMLLSSGGQ